MTTAAGAHEVSAGHSTTALVVFECMFGNTARAAHPHLALLPRCGSPAPVATCPYLFRW